MSRLSLAWSNSFLVLFSRLLHIFPFLVRKCIQRPRLSLLVLGLLSPPLAYLTLWHLLWTDMGRWWWNYGMALHPFFAYIAPKGEWGPIERPPKWIQEIYDAPWMGDWEIPRLSKPVYNRSHMAFTSTDHEPDLYRSLVSPVILKLHIFSTVSQKSREKRVLMRQHSPLLNIPKPYLHLIEVKFVLGHAYRGDWSVDEEMEELLKVEQETHGDLIRLNLVHGENLREGKILDWIHAAGTGEDGGRPGWFLFKMDDDTVLNLPVFLDTLIFLDPHQPHYLGTSLARWPAYNHHFTGMLTGFSWGLVRTLAAGIGMMSRQDIEAWYDDDVLTGEIMFDLPPAPQCRQHAHTNWSENPLPSFCNPREPPPWGYDANPPSPDPRTGLIRYDFLARMGDPEVFWVKGDVAMHSWWFKFPEPWVKQWEKKVKGTMWTPPRWLEKYADDKIQEESTTV